MDGSNIDGVVISNVTMRDMQAAFFIRLGNRGRGLAVPTAGSLANVSISNVIATGCSRTGSITGLAGASVREISLSDVGISSEERATAAGDLNVPENPGKYPEATMLDAFVHGSKASVPPALFLRLTGGSKVVETGNSLLKP